MDAGTRSKEETEAPSRDDVDEAVASHGLQQVIPKREKHWWQYPQLLMLNLGLSSALLAQSANGYDSSMLNGLQAVPSWVEYFDKPAGLKLGAVSNGITYGILFSMPFSYWLCERFGRRWPMFGGSALLILGTIIQTAAQSFEVFVVSRFIAGIGIGIISVVAPLLLSEITYPSQRAVMTAAAAIFWPFGAVIAAGVTYGTFKMESTWAWRIPSLLQGVLPAFQIVLLFFVPESPRWLIDQGRREEAERILVKYHGLGDSSSPLVQYELAEISAAIEMETMAKASRWSQWFATRGNLYRLFLVVFLGFVRQLQGNGLVSYYLILVLESVGITSSKSILLINIGLQIWSTITSAVCALTVEKMGRRLQVISSLFFMFVAFLIWTILSQQAEATHYKNSGLSGGVIAMIFVFQAFSHLYSPAVNTYVMEIAQYSLRSKASMIFTLVQNSASLFNGFVNPIAVKNIGWRYYIVYVVLLFFDAVLLYLYMPETKHMSLEEVSAIFDGDDALISWKGVRKVSRSEREAKAGRYLANSAMTKGVVEHVEDD